MNDKTNLDFQVELVFDFQSTLRQEIEKDIILDRPYGQLDIPNTVRHHRANGRCATDAPFFAGYNQMNGIRS